MEQLHIGLVVVLVARQSSTIQQGGTTIRSAETSPVLDFRALSDAQLHTAHAIFDEFRQLDL